MEPARVFMEMQEGTTLAVEDAGAALGQAATPADLGEQFAERAERFAAGMLHRGRVSAAGRW